MTPRIAGLVALTMIAFAANSVLNRLALAEHAAGPASFAAVRLVAGAAVLVALVSVRDGSARLTSALRWQNAAALAVYMLGFAFAYIWLDAGLGALILFGSVQLTMFGGALLSGETIPARRWIGAALAFAGVVWLLRPTGLTAPEPAGAVLMAVAGIAWGVYSLLGRGNKDPLASTASAFCLAVPVGFLFAVVFRDGMSAYGILLAALSGGVTSGLGYALWYRLLPQLPSSSAAVAQLTVPVIAATGGVVLLSEPVGLRFVVSCALVIAGVLLALPVSRRGR